MMDEYFQSDLWKFWNKEIKNACENSNTLCIAVFSIDGELCFANDAMKNLFLDTPEKSFINPSLETLGNLEVDEFPVFSGYMTIGNRSSSKNISIQGESLPEGKTSADSW